MMDAISAIRLMGLDQNASLNAQSTQNWSLMNAVADAMLQQN